MLRLFRARAWCLVTAILLAAGTTTAGFDELLHATGTAHDAACAPAIDLAHDASSHRVEAPDNAASGDGHCVACHLARTSRLGAQSASYGVHADEPRALVAAPATPFVVSAVLDSLPPRSPPTLA
jgi:hypothetical protein